ncbi:unnamed protein product [Clonostachys byssicola]|uniref:CHAT domain-containing protein n=1 Tax=Clonostachys byssicola TaxID=160290 RepID=A0A9N9U680_9HYPO|nr:unnamed protein product [Clonostachys byssicola]
MKEAQAPDGIIIWRHRLKLLVNWPQVILRHRACWVARCRYGETEQMKDFDEAMRLAQRNVAFLPLHHAYLSDLAMCLADRYRFTRNDDDFEEARRLYRHILDDEPRKRIEAETCQRFCLLYYSRSQITGQHHCAEEAVRLAESATRSSHTRALQSQSLSFLSFTLFNGYMMTADHDKARALDYLERGIRAARQGVQMPKGCDEARQILKDCLEHYYKETGQLSALEEAISLARNASASAPKNSRDEYTSLFTLRDFLHDLHGQTGSIESLREAEEVHEKATEIAHRLLVSILTDHYSYIHILKDLSWFMFCWHKKTGGATELTEALRLIRQAIELCPAGLPEQAQWRILYGDYLAHWSEEVCPLSEVLDGAEIVMEAANFATDDCLWDTRPILQLIKCLTQLYHITRELKYLEKSVSLARRAIDTIPRDSLTRGTILTDLVLLLKIRYLNTHSSSDLTERISIAKQLVDETSSSHPDRSNRLRLYADTLISSISRDYTADKMAEAISMSRLAVDTASNDMSRYLSLTILTSSLLTSFKRSKSIKELDEAIQVSRDAAKCATGKYKPYAWSYLSSTLRSRYENSMNLNDIDEAIDTARIAISFSPVGSYEEIINATYLGSYLLAREQHVNRGADLAEAQHILGKFLTSNYQYYNMHFIETARDFINTCNLGADLERGFEMSCRVIDLLPRMLPNSLEHSDKQWVLRAMVQIASSAASQAFDLGKEPMVALDVLERGRWAFGKSVEDTRRTDILKLEERNPQIIKRLLRLRDQLSGPATSSALPASPAMQAESVDDDERLPPSSQSPTDERYHAGIEFGQIMKDISKMPGFQPLNEYDYRQAASRGPVAIINSGTFCGWAILVELHQIRAIRLPGFSHGVVEGKLKQGHLSKPSILKWLWDGGIRQVLEALGYFDPVTGNTWPHVWWVPVGSMSKFPLHAAGYHVEDPARTVIDRVVSSYSSSITALIYGRRRLTQPSFPSGKAVLVAMENTPHLSRLPYASEEINNLTNLCTSMGLRVDNPPKSKGALLQQLPNCRIFHFAGHACTNQLNPSQSYLCPEDGPDDPITVDDLLKLNLHMNPPFLAYLSACGTGRIDEQSRLMDESIHLISSCQLAGFRHVIGTLWEVNDEICVDVAKTVYEGIRDGEGSDESVSRGLHTASKLLRDRWSTKIQHEMDEAERNRQTTEARGEGIIRGTASDAAGLPIETRNGVVRDNLPLKKLRHWVVRSRDEHQGGDKASSETGNARDIASHPAAVFNSTGTKQQVMKHVLRKEDRDIVAVADEDDMAPPLWVPYVHFGV